MLPTASELLTAWERGLSMPVGERALELAGLARPDLAEPDLDALTAGELDTALLDLRERLFGASIDAVLTCTDCGETLEVAPSVGELRAEDAGPTARAGTLRNAGYEVEFKQPTALDLAEIAHETDLESARAALLGRCVLEASVGGRRVDTRDLPEGVVAALDEALAAADPQADLELVVDCPACGHGSTTRFDVASFLWSELERFALGLLHEINVLASVYGWSESQILALGPRRRLYLELIEG